MSTSAPGGFPVHIRVSSCRHCRKEIGVDEVGIWWAAGEQEDLFCAHAPAVTLDARKPGFLGVRHATFELTPDGRVILHSGTPSGEDVTARCGGPLGGPDALPAAITGMGWEVAS